MSIVASIEVSFRSGVPRRSFREFGRAEFSRTRPPVCGTGRDDRRRMNRDFDTRNNRGD